MSSLHTLDDNELVTELLAGDYDALTILFQRYSALVFRIARRMLRDDGEAEETVQQVFLDMYRAVAQFNPKKGSFKLWLLHFAYHRSINRKQHLQSQQFYNRKDLDETGLSADSSSSLQLCSPEIVRLVEELLATLKPAQRRTIELTFFHGFTAKEISLRTGESAPAVRHNLYRGLSNLRSALLARQQDRETAKEQRRIGQPDFYVADPRTL